jgi:hypothetical protein
LNYNTKLFSAPWINPTDDFDHATVPNSIAGNYIDETNIPMLLSHSSWYHQIVDSAIPALVQYTRNNFILDNPDASVVCDSLRWYDWYSNVDDRLYNLTSRAHNKTLGEMVKMGIDMDSMDDHLAFLSNNLFNVYPGVYINNGSMAQAIPAFEDDVIMSNDAEHRVIERGSTFRRRWVKNLACMPREDEGDNRMDWGNTGTSYNIKLMSNMKMTTSPIGCRFYNYPVIDRLISPETEHRSLGHHQSFRDHYTMTLRFTPSVVRFGLSFGKLNSVVNDVTTFLDVDKPYNVWFGLYSGAKELAIQSEKTLHDTNFPMSQLLMERNTLLNFNHTLDRYINMDATALHLQYEWRKNSGLPPFKPGGVIYDSYESLFLDDDYRNQYNAHACFQIMKYDNLFGNNMPIDIKPFTIDGRPFTWPEVEELVDLDMGNVKKFWCHMFGGRWNRFSLFGIDESSSPDYGVLASIDFTDKTPVLDYWRGGEDDQRIQVVETWSPKSIWNQFDILAEVDSLFKFMLTNIDSKDTLDVYWTYVGGSKNYLTYYNLRSMYTDLGAKNPLAIKKFNSSYICPGTCGPQDKMFFRFHQYKGWLTLIKQRYDDINPYDIRIDDTSIYRLPERPSDAKNIFRTLPVTQKIDFSP